jgi:hypothetical protein
MVGGSEKWQFSPRELQKLIHAERAGLPFVWWRDDDHELDILTLPTSREPVTIGRRREQSVIALTWDGEVSRMHAYLELVGGEWTLVDDGLSRNGSFVNGNRVHGRTRLHDKDNLRFGNTRVVFREPDSAGDSASTARAQGTPAVAMSEGRRKVLIELCRPVVAGSATTPATNVQIAAEVHLSVDAVKAHLRNLFDQFGLAELPQNEKRARLVATVVDSEVLTQHDF